MYYSTIRVPACQQMPVRPKKKKVCKNSCQTRKKLIEMLTIISSGGQVNPIQVQQMFSDFGHYF